MSMPGPSIGERSVLSRLTAAAGGHTRPILRELGYSDEQVDGLQAAGVVFWEETVPLVASSGR